MKKHGMWRDVIKRALFTAFVSIALVSMSGCGGSSDAEIAGLKIYDDYSYVILDRPDSKPIKSLFHMSDSFNEHDTGTHPAVAVSTVGGPSVVVNYDEVVDGGWVAWTDSYCLYTPDDVSSDKMKNIACVLGNAEVETYDLSDRSALEDAGIELGSGWN